jgi:NADH-quinone oxidoreductase subunit E
MTAPPCVDTALLDPILARYPAAEPSLIQVLQDVHRAYNYLPCEVLAKVAVALEVPLARVFSAATFYRAFSLTPQGRVIVKVCTGTACHIRGAGQLVEEIERKLGIKPGETTQDLGFTVKTVNCVGACAMAPVLIVAEKYHGGAKPAKMGKYLGQGARPAEEDGGGDEN